MAVPAADKNILLMTKGHPFEKEAFFSVFDALHGLTWTHVEQPAAQAFYDPVLAADYDAFVLYDMPGIQFDPAGGAPVFVTPSDKLRDDFQRLTEVGHGFVVLHHAIAGWPAWSEYGDALGARFHYQPHKSSGKPQPGSGYRHSVKQKISVIGEHPVTRGIESFEIEDEAYLFSVNESDIIPLLQSNFDFVDDNFYSAANALKGKMFSSEGWSHPPASSCVGWVKSYNNSPIVYLQFGDGPAAWENSSFRQLLANAINWVSSDEARSWARSV